MVQLGVFLKKATYNYELVQKRSEERKKISFKEILGKILHFFKRG